jgi:hypothetical protein
MELMLRGPVDHVDLLAREPMVVQHPNGALFVAGYGSGFDASEPQLYRRPNLWTSRDRGATWARVNVGPASDGALGNSDVDLAAARDGTLYFVNLIYDPPTREGDFVTIGMSRDAGMTWSWKTLSRNHFDDRPWVKVAPDGTVHVIWNDGGVVYRASRDRGATWSEPVRLNEHGGSSHLAVGPHGEVAVRITPLSASGFQYDEGVDLIAVSADGGKSWRKHPAPGDREWTKDTDDPPVPRWVEPLAWGPDGSLYSLWTNLKGLWLARSRDKGETWRMWQVLQSDDILYYPYLSAGPQSQLAGTWFSGKGDNMHANVALFQIRERDAPPRTIQSHPFQIDSWTRPGKKAVTRSSGGEYLGITFLREGGFGIVSPIYNGETERAGFSWWKAEVR